MMVSITHLGDLPGLSDASIERDDTVHAVTDTEGSETVFFVDLQIDVQPAVVTVRGEDYPSLAAIWENDEDDAPPADAV